MDNRVSLINAMKDTDYEKFKKTREFLNGAFIFSQTAFVGEVGE
jgi:hypothetical protein